MSRFLSLLIGFLLVGMFAFGPIAYADELSTKPVLRIEAGMHTNAILSMSMDVAKHFLVTASQDNTVRVWEWPAGRLLQVLRPPLWKLNDVEQCVVALSPDAGTVACSFSSRSHPREDNKQGSLFLFDRASGTLRRRLLLPSQINTLAFSPDGSLLVAGCADGTLNPLRTTDYTAAQPPIANSNSIVSMDFDSKGRLVLVSSNGSVCLYSAEFTLLSKRQFITGSDGPIARFAPNGTKIVLMGMTLRVQVLDATNLSTLSTPDMRGLPIGDDSDPGALALVAACWSQDSNYLYAGGMYKQQATCMIRCWAEGGKGKATDLPASAYPITCLLPAHEKGVFYGAGDPLLGEMEPEGKRRIIVGAVTAYIEGATQNCGISEDGLQVQFGFEKFGKSPARFSLRQRRLELDPANDALVRAPITQSPSLQITDWENNLHPKWNGKALSTGGGPNLSLAIAPNTESFLLGSVSEISCYRVTDAGEQAWKVPVPEGAWALNIAGNNKLAVAALGDGTIRWYRMTDGKELLAFYPHTDKKRWVVWTPSGYYDCSADGEELVGWHINRGKEQAADFFPTSRLRGIYYRPDIIAKVLEIQNEETAVLLAEKERGDNAHAASIEKSLPPILRLVAPASQTDATSTTLTVKYALRSPSGEPITDIKALIDGRPISEARKFEEVPATDSKDKETFREITLTLPAHNCEVSLLAYNRYAASVPATLRVTWKGHNPDEVKVLKPKLYILAIGAGDYQDRNVPKLTYPAKDAADFVTRMQAQKGLLYQEVTVRLLTDGKATREAILDGMDWIQKETTGKDVAMVFLSGHGLRDRGGDYYYIPIDYVFGKSRSTAIPFSEIQKTITSLAGKALFFVDTCHSGFSLGDPGKRAKGDSSDINAVVNELASVENGAVVFAASTGKEESLEADEWHNGAFTKALLEGLSGKADVRHSGRITITMLEFYISERVKELTKGAQHPTMRKPDVVPDFPLAIVP